MDKKILISRFNELEKITNENTLRLNLYGYMTEIILSTELFHLNKDLQFFFKYIDIPHKDYLYSSRTSLIAMTIRKIQKMDIKQLLKLRANTSSFLIQESDMNFIQENRKTAKKLKKDTDYVNEIVEKYSRGND